MAVIVAPFRALCYEIRESLIKGFISEFIFINELSDVLQPDYSVERFLGRKQVLVVTPEKLNYVLRHTPVIGERIGLIIMTRVTNLITELAELRTNDFNFTKREIT